MKRVKGIPKYLYHYTDLKTLKLILMNKTLRFTSLKYMDDRTESLTGEGNDLGKFIFSSSWSEEEDNIPQWAMYGDSSRGVCIKMESFPFKNNYSEYSEYSSNKIEMCYLEEVSEIYITPPKYIFESGFVLKPLFIDDGINIRERRESAKVIYTDDESLIFPKIINDSSEGFEIGFGKLGCHKNKQWEFQKEWRYKLLYIPIDVQKYLEEQDPDLVQGVVQNIFSEEQPNVKFVDYNIDEKYINTMEIICGAMMDDFDYRELTFFCKGINPNIKVRRSSLFNKWHNKNID